MSPCRRSSRDFSYILCVKTGGVSIELIYWQLKTSCTHTPLLFSCPASGQAKVRAAQRLGHLLFCSPLSPPALASLWAFTTISSITFLSSVGKLLWEVEFWHTVGPVGNQLQLAVGSTGQPRHPPTEEVSMQPPRPKPCETQSQIL